MNIKKPAAYISFALSILLLISSCVKNAEPFDPAIRLEEEKAIIASYATNKYPNMKLSSDTTGIWYEVIEPGEENSYQYKVVDTVFNGQNTKTVRPPMISVKYMGKLISNETIFDSNQTETGLSGKTTDFISAWYYAFMPKSIDEHKIGGLTPKGLQKGTKIRIITPSYFAYGPKDMGQIPRNSPLYFEIEVIDIK